MTKCPRLFLGWENSRHFRRPHWFPREMTSVQKFHTDHVSLPRSEKCFWLVETNFSRDTTNQKHYSDLGSDASSVRNFCACFSDVISRGNQWWRRKMSAVFQGLVRNKLIIYNARWQFITHDVTVIQWTPKWYTTTKITTNTVEVKSVGTGPFQWY